MKKKLFFSCLLFAIGILSSCSPAKCKHLNTTTHEHVVSAQTCVDDGLMEIETVCVDCEEIIDTEIVVLEATGHEGDTIPALEPTCTEDGHNEYMVCEKCGYSSYEVIPATGHNLDEENPIIKTIREPTCTRRGSASVYATCLNCFEEFLVDSIHLEPLGHDLEDRKGLDPTCTEHGYTDYQGCTRCSYTVGRTSIDPTGHSISDEPVYIDAIDPTCTEEGYVIYAYPCLTCGEFLEEYYEFIEPLGHESEFVDMPDPTCTSYGYYDYYKCSRCGARLTDSFTLDPLGHDFYSAPPFAVEIVEEYGDTDLEASFHCSRCEAVMNVDFSKTNYHSLGLESLTYSLYPGETLDLPITTFQDSELVYHSSDTAVATVDENGIITAQSAGKIAILIKDLRYSTSDWGDLYWVVLNVKPHYLNFSLESSMIYETQTTKIINLSSSSDEIKYESLDDTIATVDANGVITGLKAGTTTIRGSVYNYSTIKDVEITVVANHINLVETQVVCYLNKTLDLSKYVRTSIEDNLTYVSSDESIGMIRGSTIYGLSAGTVVVTISGEKCGSTEITVTVREKILKTVSINKNNYSTYISLYGSYYTNQKQWYFSAYVNSGYGYTVTTPIYAEISLEAGDYYPYSYALFYIRIAEGSTSDSGWSSRDSYTTRHTWSLKSIKGEISYYY